VRALLRALLRVALALVVLAASFLYVRWWDFTAPSFLGPRYQAVFLANGATYFGEYRDRIGPYVKIENAYYIETPTTTSGEPGQTRLVRRGSELHAPMPLLLVPKSAVLFVENVGPSSPIAQFMDKDRR